MMKLLRKAFYSTLMFIILIIALLSFIVYTTPGLYTAIKISTLFYPGSITVHGLSGSLIDNFSIGEVNYQYKNLNIKINKATINWSFKELFHHRLVLNEFNADSIEFRENNSIKVLSQFKGSGLFNKQVGKINNAQFNFLDQQVNVALQIDGQSPHALAGKIKVAPIPKRARRANQNQVTGTISIGGTLDHIQWTGELDGSLMLTTHGTLTHLSELSQVIKWRDLHWNIDKTQTVLSPEGRITISGVFPNIKMDISSKVNTVPNDYWQIKAKIDGTVPWHWNFDAQLSQPHSSETISLAIKGSLKDKSHGNMDLTLNPGHYKMPDDMPMPTLDYLGGTVHIVLSPQSLSGKGVLALDKNKELKVNFKLPQYNLAQGISSDQPLSGELSLVLNSLDFLQNLTPEISNPRGQLTASIKTTGTIGKAQIESKLNLTKAGITLPALGLVLNAIDLTVVGKKKHWEATGFLGSEDKKLTILGKGPLDSIAGEFTIQGADFPLAKTQEYQINVSPQLKLNVTPTSLNITGSILVPSAHIKPQTFNNSLTLSDDVVYKTKEVAQPSAFNTSMNVKVEMGNQVELTFKGLHATLAGIVNVTELPQGPINAKGELSVKEGEYKAYGQDLDVEQGQLLFTGGRLDNPGISLKASKVINNSPSTTSGSNQLFDFNTNNIQNVNLGSSIKVGVEVTGRLTAPKILLFANPSILSQADILSMLILGRPANQANKAGGQLLLAAISSMNLGTGTNGAQLLEQLKQNLGFDVNVQTISNYNQQTNQVTDSTAFVVGKSLSKRLYLSYNVGLTQTDPNVLTLKYLLNKFLSIQVSNSKTGNGIDLLYSRSKNRT